MRAIAGVLVLGLGLAPVGSSGSPLPPPRSVADQVFLRLDEARREAGAPPWERRAELDEVATAAAEEIARAGDKGLNRSIEGFLDDAGVSRGLRVVPIMQSLRGYEHPAGMAVEQWRGYRQVWAELMDPKVDGIGLGEGRAADGKLVLVGVLIEDRPRVDISGLEREAEQTVNEVRASYGRAPLAHSDALAVIAREHSRDMATRGYFAHRSPENHGVSYRVRNAGLSFRIVAENISTIAGAEDPVEIVVDGWVASPGHRSNLLSPDFDESGIGVATDEDGAIFFTQVFMKGPEAEPRSGE